jgi:nitrate/nitrite transporter NarK
MGWVGAKLVNYRPIVIAVSYVLAGIFLYIAFSAATIGSSLAGLSGAGFFLYAGLASMWTVSLDLFPENLRGTFSGFINFGGQAGGFVAPISIGALVASTGSYYGGFMLMIAGLILAALCFTILQIIRIRANSITAEPVQSTTSV